MKQVTIGERVFRCQKDLESYCRGYIESTNDGDLIEISDFMLKLIAERHAEPESKIVPGLEDSVVGVRVRHESAKKILRRAKRNHTFVAYASGKEIDFSWLKCCRNGFSEMALLTCAMRAAIFEQVWGYKKLRFLHGPVSCDETGEMLTWETAQVDHFPVLFKTIRDAFLESGKYTPQDIPLQSDPRGGCVISDTDIRREWELFHENMAVLRITSGDVNKRSWRSKEAV